MSFVRCQKEVDAKYDFYHFTLFKFGLTGLWPTTSLSDPFKQEFTRRKQSKFQRKYVNSYFSDGPHFIEEPTDADVTPDGTVLFACKAKYQDQILQDISWTKDNNPIQPNRGSRVQILPRGNLYISNAQRSDVGIYKCHVSGLTSRPARIRFYQGRAKPTIVHSPTQTNVEKGSTIRLNCVAAGFPRPSYAWYKDGGRLSTAHSRFKVRFLMHF